jgi:phage-related protein
MTGTSVGSAYVSVIPKVEGDAQSVGSDIGSKLSGGMKGPFGAGVVALGNMLANALTGVASSVGETVSKTFWNYADFEQLSGGVEKIFDQADTGKILQDAQNAYRDLNMSVNQYLESINQTGAAFAQTMGDEKGYETARKGMLAISDYASGTGRNLDELNEKYALITRSTSSYQSIADQFSGILPATSKDFLEQAQAAGFLEKSYTSLTEVPIDEYQQAVTQMLEKGVEDMGLAGNTALESATTLSGSLAMLSSSWENLLTAIGDGGESMDLGAAFTGFTDALAAAASNILPTIARIGETIVMELPPMIGEALATLPGLIQESVTSAFGEDAGGIVGGWLAQFDGIGEQLQVIFEDLQSIFQQAFGALQPLIMPLLDGVVSVIATTAVNVVSLLSQITGFLANDVMPTVTGVIESITPLLEDSISFVSEFASAIIDTLGDAFELVLDLAQDVWPDVSSTITTVVNAVAPVVRNVFGGIKTFVTGAFNAVKGIASAVWPAVSNVVKTAVNAAKSAVSTAVGAIKGFFNGLRSIVGVVRGTFDAVKTAITRPIETAKATVKGILDNIKGFFPLSIGKVFSNLQLPHISVNGGSPPFGIGGKGSLPSFNVNWYARGGIADGAQLIGAGENGPEFIWPSYDPYMDKYAKAIAKHIPDGGGGITVNFTYNCEGDATEAVNLLTANLRQLKATGAF